MVDMSLILCTARDNYSIIDMPDVFLLEPMLKSLETQTFRDFELVIVDAFYPEKRELIFSKKWRYPIKYVPPHPNHDFWIKKGIWGFAGMLNTAIIHTEGELIVKVDDCCKLPDEHYLKKFWDGYMSGYFPMALHVRYRKDKPAVVDDDYIKRGYEVLIAEDKENVIQRLKTLYGEGGVIRDTRWTQVEKVKRMIAPPNWFYGYSSFPINAALRINGYNELLDGQKGLEDVDFGIRLDMAGYHNVLTLDKDLWIIEYEHYPCKIKSPDVYKCNYGIIQYEQSNGIYEANTWKLSKEDCYSIRKNICPKCPNYSRCLGEELKGQFFIDNEDFNLWLDNQRVFSLFDEMSGLLNPV